jgi:hypothetical protein
MRKVKSPVMISLDNDRLNGALLNGDHIDAKDQVRHVIVVQVINKERGNFIVQELRRAPQWQQIGDLK